MDGPRRILIIGAGASGMMAAATAAAAAGHAGTAKYKAAGHAVAAKCRAAEHAETMKNAAAVKCEWAVEQAAAEHATAAELKAGPAEAMKQEAAAEHKGPAAHETASKYKTAMEHAADKGRVRVTVLEHNSEAGRKLLLTGRGRCNYTNTDVSPAHYHCDDEGFLRSLLAAFTYEDCIDFFRKINIEPMVRHYRFDDTGYVYPANGGAKELRDCLYNECLRLGVEFRFNMHAEELGIKRSADGRFYSGMLSGDRYDALIIAAGSNAAPLTGSDSSIYPLLKSLGAGDCLGFKGFLPALCPLFSKDPELERLKGIRRDARVVLVADNGFSAACYGEVQFNQHSLSGIPVMQLSRHAGICIKNNIGCRLVIDGHSYEIYRTAGFGKAQCCSGGIGLEFVDPGTMMSRIVPGVFFCGEILDIDGECGGYNLHLAWASGYVAGRSAACIK